MLANGWHHFLPVEAGCDGESIIKLAEERDMIHCYMQDKVTTKVLCLCTVITQTRAPGSLGFSLRC